MHDFYVYARKNEKANTFVHWCYEETAFCDNLSVTIQTCVE